MGNYFMVQIPDGYVFRKMDKHTIFICEEGMTRARMRRILRSGPKPPKEELEAVKNLLPGKEGEP